MTSKARARDKERANSKQRSPFSGDEPRRASLRRHLNPNALYQQARIRAGAVTPREVLQLQRTIGNRAVAQLLTATAPEQNRTGLPDELKTGVETLSGISLDDVRVHYDSPRPAAVQALAYTQGIDIHLGAGQAEHLPHEAWHVVQQKQRRVSLTKQLNGVAVNDDPGLEREAETMGARALGLPAPRTAANTSSPRKESAGARPVLQGFFKLDQADKAQGKGPLFQTQSPEPQLKGSKQELSLDYDAQETPQKEARLLVADDLSMAVQDTVREPKEFFAVKAVVANSNKQLAEVQSPLRLEPSEGTLNVGPAQLERIQPRAIDKDKVAGEFPALWHDICINITNSIMGNRGYQREEVLLRHPKSKKTEGMRIDVDNLGAEPVTRLARHLARGPQPQKRGKKKQQKPQTRTGAALEVMGEKGNKPDFVGAAYGRALAAGRVDEEAHAIGVNQYAEPEVGEGFAIFSISASETQQLDYSQSEPRADPVVKQDTWGYHHAAVVARSLAGDDRVTLENYRRSLQAEDLVRKHLWNKYRSDAQKKARELQKKLSKAKRRDPNWPLLLREDVYQYLTGRHTQAAEEYMALMTGTDFKRLWFFRMYGSRKGQTFHERQAESGSYVNPLTLRVRRHMPTVIARYQNSLQNTSQRLSDLLTSPALTHEPTRGALAKLEASAQAQIDLIDAQLEKLAAAAKRNADVHAALKEANGMYHTWVRETLAPGLGRIIQEIRRGKAPRVKTESLEALRELASAEESPSLFDLLGDMFFIMHQGLPEDEVQRRDTLAELRRLVPQLPADALADAHVEKDGPSADASAKPHKLSKLSRVSGKTLGKYEHELEGTRVAEFLAYRGLAIQETVRNGDCMYDAIRWQLGSVDGLNTTIRAIRAAVARLIRDNDDYFADFVADRDVNAVAQQISRVQSWDNEGGDIAARVIATVLQRDVIVISPNGIDRRQPLAQLAVNQAARIGGGGGPLTIVYNGVDHYYSTRAA